MKKQKKQVQIKRPLLAETIEDISSLTYPIYCSPKIDGVRCLIVNGVAVTRKLLPIPNTHIRETLQKILPEGADGEITIAGDIHNFSKTTSIVRREEGEPDFKFHWFDWVMDDPNKPFLMRQMDLVFHAKKNPNDIIIPTVSWQVDDKEALLKVEQEYLSKGYEGVMVRSGEGRYKFGRSTLKEGILLKLKRFTDAEAEIIGFEEKMHNTNEATSDELGYMKRSTSKEGLVGMKTLGTLLAKDLKTGAELRIGTGKGLGDKLRKHIWRNRKKWLGKIIKYRYQEAGKKNLPRFPVFLGERMKEDM